MKTHSLRKNIVLQMAYKTLTLITPLITTPHLTRVLGPQVQGIYAYSLSIVGYFTMFAYLGIDTYGTRCIARINDHSISEIKKMLGEIFTVQVTTSIISIFAFLIYFFFCISEYRYLYIIQGFALISALIEVYWYFAGTEQFALIIKRDIIIKILTVILILVVVKKKEDLEKYALIMVMSNLISQGLMWFFLIKQVGYIKFSYRNFIIHMKENIRLFMPVLALSVYHIMDKTMLGELSTYEEVAYYANVDKIINMPLSLITGIGIVMLPRMTSIYAKCGNKEASKMFEKSYELFTSSSIILSCVICVIAKEFVPLFFGKGYDSCVMLTYLFAPVLLIKSLSNLIQTQILIPQGKEKSYTIATIIGACINLICNLFLIPKYGSIGATIGTLCAEGALLLVLIISIKNEIDLVKLLKNCLFYYTVPVALTIIILGSWQHFSFVNPLISISIKMVLFMLLCGLCSILYWKKKKESIFNRYMSILERGK